LASSLQQPSYGYRYWSLDKEGFMEQRDETNRAEYPRGRGYGHDYMRGGEVFGGYGYRERAEYVRPRGESDEPESATEDGHSTDAGQLATATEEEMLGAAGRFPQDMRAGGWTEETPSEDAAAMDGSAAPVPHLEHTFGDSGPRYHSRSFYVTQAQLQQRFYAPKRTSGGPYDARLRTLQRPDDALKKDVQEALFYDTWVDAERIAVEVRDGVVTLRGTLPRAEEIRFACDDAWEVAGVREVRSELQVERPT
jgi:hypothetical protein